MVTNSQGCNFFFTPNTRVWGGWTVLLTALWRGGMGHVSGSFPSQWGCNPWGLSFKSWRSGILLDSPCKTIPRLLVFFLHTSQSLQKLRFMIPEVPLVSLDKAGFRALITSLASCSCFVLDCDFWVFLNLSIVLSCILKDVMFYSSFVFVFSKRFSSGIFACLLSLVLALGALDCKEVLVGCHYLPVFLFSSSPRDAA